MILRIKNFSHNHHLTQISQEKTLDSNLKKLEPFLSNSLENYCVFDSTANVTIKSQKRKKLFNFLKA